MVPEAAMNSPCKVRNAIQRAVLLQRRPERFISAVQHMAPSAVISSLLWVKVRCSCPPPYVRLLGRSGPPAYVSEVPQAAIPEPAGLYNKRLDTVGEMSGQAARAAVL